MLSRALDDQPSDFLLSRFLFAPDYPLYFFAEHQDLDSTVAAELAAIRMIRKPSKVSKFPVIPALSYF